MESRFIDMSKVMIVCKTCFAVNVLELPDHIFMYQGEPRRNNIEQKCRGQKGYCGEPIRIAWAVKSIATKTEKSEDEKQHD
jgi:hypothetical protein